MRRFSSRRACARRRYAFPGLTVTTHPEVDPVANKALRCAELDVDPTSDEVAPLLQNDRWMSGDLSSSLGSLKDLIRLRSSSISYIMAEGDEFNFKDTPWMIAVGRILCVGGGRFLG